MTNFTPIPNPLVSVIVPTYNRAYCLGRTIKSVIDQTYPYWEMIIVDNHSTDNTDELIANFNDSRIKVIKIHNKGVIAASRNKGLRASHGEYIAFLDSDDWWLSEKLTVSVEHLDAGADLVYHDLYLISSLPAKPRFWNRGKPRQVGPPVLHDLLFNGNALYCSSVVVRRNLMMHIGGFSEDSLLIAAEDFDAWLRLTKCTEKFVRLKNTLGFYWAGGGNYSSPKKTINSLTRLCELYVNELNDTELLPVWMAYHFGRAYYLEKEPDLAVKYLKIPILKADSLLIKAKAFITWLMVKI